MTPAITQAAHAWFVRQRENEIELQDPRSDAYGRLVRFSDATGEHYSLELDGVTPAQVERILRVLNLGSMADPCLERTIAEASPWDR